MEKVKVIIWLNWSEGAKTVFAFLPFNVGPWELILILVILLVIVGPGKLPQVGESLGKALQNFRKSKEEDFDEEDTKEGKE